MKRIVLMLLFIGLNQLISAQAIEVLDNHLFAEIEIKDKFLFFQELTINNTFNGVDHIEEVSIEDIFATKSLFQLMYWRYTDKYINESNKEIASTNTYPYMGEDNLTYLGKKCVAMGVIKNFIYE